MAKKCRIAAGAIISEFHHAGDMRQRLYRAVKKCPWISRSFRAQLRAAHSRVLACKNRSKCDTTRRDAWHRAYVRAFQHYNTLLGFVVVPAIQAGHCNWLRLAIFHHETREIERRRLQHLDSVRCNLAARFFKTQNV
jgi:hypothetical protein